MLVRDELRDEALSPVLRGMLTHVAAGRSDKGSEKRANNASNIKGLLFLGKSGML